MFVHAVYFWLRPDLSAEQKDTFLRLARSLSTEIEVVKHGFLGVPAPTNRPIIERSYNYALTLIFDDKEGHDAYQVHPVHDRFRTECAPFWTAVRIYDSVGDAGA